MIISKEKIDKIRSIIERYYNALIFKISGSEYLSDEQIEALIDSNLIDVSDSAGAISDAYYVGRFRNVNDPRDRNNDLNLAEFRRKFKDEVIPVSDSEKYSVEYIKQSAGNYITGLKDKIKTDVTGAINNNNLDYRNKIITEEIRPVLATGIEENKTISKIASDLREKTGENFRDWKRVAITEVANAMNLGEMDAIVARNRGKNSNEIYVYKRINFDAATCFFCKKAYLVDPESNAPKVFKLSELQANGSNYGKSSKEYLPTIGPLHPNCRCALVEYLPGWKFDENGRMVYEGPSFNQYNNQ